MTFLSVETQFHISFTQYCDLRFQNRDVAISLLRGKVIVDQCCTASSGGKSHPPDAKRS